MTLGLTLCAVQFYKYLLMLVEKRQELIQRKLYLEKMSKMIDYLSYIFFRKIYSVPCMGIKLTLSLVFPIMTVL